MGVAADNGLELRADTERIYMPLAGTYTPEFRSIPSGVSKETLLVSFSNGSIIRKITFESDTSYQTVGVGETVITVQTPDGRYSDSLTIVVDPAIGMASDRTTVYTNARYRSRCLAYTPERTGAYALSFSLPSASLHFAEVYDADFQEIGTPSSGETVRLVGGRTYYILPTADGDVTGNSYEFRVEYVGAAEQPSAPSSVRFLRNEITMALYDSMLFPSYTFEPGGLEWYDTVTFTSDNEDVLHIDYEEHMIEALSAGSVTLTVTADTWGWTDSVRITVVDEEREIYENEPLPLTIGDGEYRAVFFTAPETGTYTVRSVTQGDGDPVGGIFDAESGESLAVGDDEDFSDFVMTAKLRRWQRVEILVAGYTSDLHTTLHVGKATAPTGVELYLPEAISCHGDQYYIRSGFTREPLVRFLGGPATEWEEYTFTADFYDGAKRDENGDYYAESGQSVRFTVKTDSGLTKSVMVTAIDLRLGDLDFDGKIGASDAAMAFYAINGLIEADNVLLGAMEVTGDNRITLADAARVFYAANGLVEIV